MNNLSSCCKLVDAKIRASDKDLPVCLSKLNFVVNFHLRFLARFYIKGHSVIAWTKKYMFPVKMLTLW